MRKKFQCKSIGPIPIAQRKEITAARCSRIIDQNIKPAELTLERRYHRLRLIAGAKISGMDNRPAPKPADFVGDSLERIAVPRRQHDVVAAAGQFESNTSSNAPA